MSRHESLLHIQKLRKAPLKASAGQHLSSCWKKIILFGIAGFSYTLKRLRASFWNFLVHCWKPQSSKALTKISRIPWTECSQRYFNFVPAVYPQEESATSLFNSGQGTYSSPNTWVLKDLTEAMFQLPLEKHAVSKLCSWVPRFPCSRRRVTHPRFIQHNHSAIRVGKARWWRHW